MSDTRELLDRHAITDLTARLSRWLDEKRFDESRTLFTEDAVASTPGGVAEGLEALVAQAGRTHDMLGTQHFFSDVLVAHAGDKAAVRANSLVVFITDDGPRLYGARYALETVRTPAGWRISRLDVRPTWDAALTPLTA